MIQSVVRTIYSRATASVVSRFFSVTMARLVSRKISFPTIPLSIAGSTMRFGIRNRFAHRRQLRCAK